MIHRSVCTIVRKQMINDQSTKIFGPYYHTNMPYVRII